MQFILNCNLQTFPFQIFFFTPPRIRLAFCSETNFYRTVKRNPFRLSAQSLSKDQPDPIQERGRWALCESFRTIIFRSRDFKWKIRLLHYFQLNDFKQSLSTCFNDVILLETRYCNYYFAKCFRGEEEREKRRKRSISFQQLGFH